MAIVFDGLMATMQRASLNFRYWSGLQNSLADNTVAGQSLSRPSQRLVFANQLRGLAALSVVVSHLIGIYWGDRQAVAHDTATPILTGGISRMLYWVAYPWFGFGAFGVALFFLISGLVIPISLDHHSTPRFLLARLLRIYPTYVVGLTLCLLMIGFNRLYWNTSFEDGPKSIIGTMLLIQDILGVRDISMVSWTLCIELKFYFLMALIAPAIRSGSVSVLFALALGILAYNLTSSSELFNDVHATWPELHAALDTESTYVVFMLIGVLFNYRLRGLLSLTGFAASYLGMIALFSLSWLASLSHDQFPVVTVNYYYALGLFTALFVLRRYARAIWILDGLAAISFPLYVIHSLVGFSLLKLFMLSFGWGYPISLIVTVACLCVIAWAMHVSVERWSIAAGKKPVSIAGMIRADRDRSGSPDRVEMFGKKET